SVQSKFRKVKSLNQLYRWETSVQKDETNADKFAFITKYILQKFEEGYDRKSIIHDMNLRLWALIISTSRSLLLPLYEVLLKESTGTFRPRVQKSLTHNQFSSPRFKNLFQYARFKSGYLTTHPGEFPNPINFCYFENEKNASKCSICGRAAFMRCAWCGEYFCFQHFYEEYHYCTNYNP
ncbi:hypothetical protein ALC56_02900, partial [Trachymyrmex septentrionalis]